MKKTRIQNILRNIKMSIKRARFEKNQKRTIFCNMCLGGMVSHDLGLRFNSPFVNLMVPGSDFVKLLTNSSEIGGNIIEQNTDNNYPVGLLSHSYQIHFIHYPSFEFGLNKWKERCKRMDIENAYCILVETVSCTYEDLLAFDKLPFKHKIILVHKDYPELKHAQVIQGFDGKNLHGDILKYTSIFGTRMYDQVDWIKFLDLK